MSRLTGTMPSDSMSKTLHFDHYEILQRDDGSLHELGRGAMGITYKAFDTSLRVPVALKVINAAFLDSDVARQRFIREARSAAKLRHRHVASVFHLGLEGATYFYAMEYIEGETVDALIRRQGPLDPALALQITAQVARALNAAQPHGLVHRDIKPANLMLIREDGELVVKVIDFGLAKSSLAGETEEEDSATLSSGGFVGTPHFASPEQLAEANIDVRSDIYSLGVTLWYMLAGRTPFAGSMAQVMSQHLGEPPPFQQLHHSPEPVRRLLGRMLEKDPVKRPQTPGDLRSALEQCAALVRESAIASPAAPGREEPELAEPADECRWDAGAPSFAMGSTLAGRYRLEESLGESHAGRLFRADDLSSGYPVRLLILAPELTSSPAAGPLLEREIEKARGLEHPNLLRVHSLESVPGASFLALEWTDGFSLQELLRVRRELPATEVLALLAQAAEGVDYALARGVKRLDLALHQVFVHFPELLNKAALLRQPLAQWPRFVVKLNPLGITRELSASETWAGGQTMVGGLGPRGGEEPSETVQAIRALAGIVYELLGGTLSPLAFRAGPQRYTPLATLSEEGNEALKLALAPQPAYARATDFHQALVAQLETSALPPPKTRPIRPPSTVPLMTGPPALQRRPAAARASPLKGVVLLWASIAVLAGICALIYWKGVNLENSPLPTPDSPSVVDEATPPPTPGGADEASAAPPPTPSAPAVELITPPAPGPEVPAATPPPAPPRQELVKRAVLEAEAFESAESWPEALGAYVRLAREYPEFDIGRVRLELLLQRLRGDGAELKPEQFSALRDSLVAAARLGVVGAMMLLAEKLHESDPVSAFNWYSEAASLGEFAAKTQMGLMLSNGDGCKKDLDRAINALRDAAGQGHAAAMTALGECYLLGKGVPRDLKRGIELCEAAAEKGHPHAIDLLGTCYHQGNGVPQDFREALRLYTVAAELGHLPSLGNLGVLYINGEGVPENRVEAVKLFQKGARAGDAYCMVQYARCLESGTGVPPNMSQARGWYKKSAEAGNKAAAEWCVRNGVPFAAR